MPTLEMASGIAIYKIFEWVAKNFGKELVAGAAKSASKKVSSLLNSFSAKKAARSYVDNLEDVYGVMQILGLTSPIPIREIYTYVNLLTTPASAKINSDDIVESIYKDKQLFSEYTGHDIKGIDAVKQFDKLVILGKPGSGKTTFLKNVILKCVDGAIDQVPISGLLTSAQQLSDIT